MSVDSFLPWRLAQWNPTRGVWETGQHDLLSGLSELYSETWPTSGMTRGGVAYELPTPALPTGGSVSSSLPTPRASLLPTPAANDSGNTPENHLRKKHGRTVVTSLAVLVDGGLLATGGRLVSDRSDTLIKED
jgi:hypothetical protein